METYRPIGAKTKRDDYSRPTRDWCRRDSIAGTLTDRRGTMSHDSEAPDGSGADSPDEGNSSNYP
ncbi:MAG: hypothetical protein AAF488_19175, partial [Planctomycetota bacterium]